MDVLTPEQRRKNMQRIRSKDTKAELLLRKALWKEGYRYRKNYKLLPGTPDIVLTKYKIAIFVDSEFFHGRNWEVLQARLNKGSRGEYWIGKIRRNMERDYEVDQKLRSDEWIVLHFWDKDIEKHLDECVQTIKEVIFDNNSLCEFDYPTYDGKD